MRSEVFPFADEVKSSTFAEQTWLLYLTRKRSHRTIKKKKKKQKKQIVPLWKSSQNFLNCLLMLIRK